MIRYRAMTTLTMGIFMVTRVASHGANGLIGHWVFEGRAATVVHDSSGLGYHGQIHNAEHMAVGQRGGLRFRGADSHVDCGRNNALTNLTGDMTILAWVKLEASPFPDATTNFHIVHCEDYAKSGYMLRVDGATGKLTFRTNQMQSNQYGFSRIALQNGRFHHIGLVKRGSQVMYYIDTTPDLQFTVRDPLPSSVPFRISSETQSFEGLIAEVRVYSRALSTGEIIEHYKQHAAEFGKDTSWFGKLTITPYPYFSEGRLDVEVNLLGVLPLQLYEELIVEFGRQGDQPVVRMPRPECLASGKCEFTFNTQALSLGEYVVRAAVKSGEKVRAETSYVFRYPVPPPTIPSPSRRIVGPLPKPPAPLPFSVTLAREGGLLLTVRGKETYRVDSLFSFPYGGYNAFRCSSATDSKAEPAWKVISRKVRPDEFAIEGEGRFYRIVRLIRLTPTHVTIKDTISNKTADPIGIILSHHLRTKAGDFASAYLAGRSVSGEITRESIKSNPTLFLSRQGLGMGLVALDDVFIVQSKAFRTPDAAGIITDQFALDAKASYTLEWAIYLNSTGNYWDLINQIRRDEGRNNVTVEGGFAFISRGTIPPKGYIEMRNLKYLSLACLSHATDDPEISLEGIEFMEYPMEKAVIREQFAKIQKDYPDLKLMFHIAHSLYATNRPEQIFSDSRVIDANGRQPVYPYSYDSYGYFSKARVEDNWRWWIYYPTSDNSFGRALLRSVDVMMDELGCRGAFMDGFMIAYGGEYTYDRWDGHTAEIDPETKTIKRKMGSVLLLSQDVLAEFCRRMLAKGGTPIANGAVVTRTIGKLPIPHDLEITEGPGVHLAPAPCALGNPFAITCEKDIHKDVIAKLNAANLYFYYGEKEITRPGAPSEMYPITIEELHSGYIKGKERLITLHPGIYGWVGDMDLHFGYLFHDRGHEMPHDFLTTVDAAGVRTEVNLAADQIAILKKIPVTVRTDKRVNVHVTRYGADKVELILNGTGTIEVTIRDGEFRVIPGHTYRVTAPISATRQAGSGGRLGISVLLQGQTRICIAPVAHP